MTTAARRARSADSMRGVATGAGGPARQPAPVATVYWATEPAKTFEVVSLYLCGGVMNTADVQTMRRYLVRWIDQPKFDANEYAKVLRQTARLVQSRFGLDSWIAAAMDAGIDPL